MGLKAQKIELVKVIAPNVSSRDAISLVDQKIKRSKSKEIILDFSSVEFLSRSASKELLRAQRELERRWFRRKKISFSNVSKDVQDVLDASSVTRKTRRINDDIKEVTLRDFLVSK